MNAPRTGPRSYGLTLLELLLAMAILSLGLIMSAGVFAAGLRQNQVTAEQALGQVICQNALATYHTRGHWWHSGWWGWYRAGDITDNIGRANLEYPLARPDELFREGEHWRPRRQRGALLFIYWPDPDAEHAILVAVAWRSTNPNHYVTSRLLPYADTEATLTADGVVYTLHFHDHDRPYVKSGTVALFTDGPNQGQYAWVDGVDGSVARLRHVDLKPGPGRALVVYESTTFPPGLPAPNAPGPVTAVLATPIEATWRWWYREYWGYAP